MIEPINTLEEFRAALKAHDWGYQFSDDQRVWRAGSDENKRLLDACKKFSNGKYIWNSIAPYYARLV